MEQIRKGALLKDLSKPTDSDMDLINAQSLRVLSADEVFTFCLEGCNTQIDRDYERFTPEALEEMARLYPGRPVLRGHQWTPGAQLGRVYAAGVEQAGEGRRLVLRCYMPRTQGTAETIAAIESGVIRECSVGLRVGRSTCSICGAVQPDAMCRHRPGREYDGRLCHFDLDDIRDVYEVSLVAVPAQPAAGVIKGRRCGGDPQEDEGAQPPQNSGKALQRARARLALEKIRFGGD